MSLRFAPILSLFCLLTGFSQALAQAFRPDHTKRAVIEKTCARDLERFCPELANTGQLRNQVICLKPYRLDLSLPCRRAVTAALH